MISPPHVRILWRTGALLAFMLAGVSQVGAQQVGIVTGRVLDQAGAPLPAVQVTFTALSIGVLTPQNGVFTLQDVPVGTHVLTAQRLGYGAVTQDVTVTAGETVTVDFQLSQQALALDEVLVTGTAGGTQRRAIGNVVTQVRAAEVAERMTVTNMGDLLGGRAPGLQFARNSGVVGVGSAIRIRGVGSVTLGSQPLVFIDGIRASNRTDAGPLTGGNRRASALDDLNPNDIESIEIIKGPAAATLYGTEASEGVIQIITKRGAQGTPQFDLAIHQGARFMIDPAGKIGTQYACRSAPTPPCPLEDIFTYNMYDEANRYIRRIRETGTSGLYEGGPYEWNSYGCPELYCNGRMETYSLSIRGGTEILRYFVSTEYLGDNGIVTWNTNDRLNVRGNLNLLLTPNLSLNLSTGYTNGYTRFSTVESEGDLFDEMQWSLGYCLDRINPGACPRLGGFQERLPNEIDAVENTREWNRFIGSFTAQHVFREWLTQRVIFGIDKTWETNRNLWPLDDVSPSYRNAPVGMIRYERPNDNNLTLDYAISAQTRLTDSFSLTTSAGIQYYENLQETFRNTGQGFALPVQTTVNQTQASLVDIGYTFRQNKSLGAFIQEELNWNSRAFLTVAVRADDNSAFGADFDAQYYPKVSGTWVISEEAFFDFPLVNTLRLRSALGQAGRQPGTFDGRTIWVSYTGPPGQGAVRPSSPGNPEIGPEVSTELEVGFDLAFLGDRIEGEFTYFTKKTEDALLNAALEPSRGQPGTIARNLGRIDTWGWEARLSARVATRQNFAFDLDLSGDFVDNEIKELGNFPGSNSVQVGYPFPNTTTAFRVVGWSDELNEFGQPVEVYCDAGVPTGRDGRFPGGETVNCDTVRGQPLLSGRTFYTHTFSVQPTVTLFNNIRIFALAQGMYGKTGAETQVGWGLRYNNGYCGQALTNDPVCVEWIARNWDGMFRDEWMQSHFKADFWKLRELGVQYELPQSLTQRTGASRASLSLSAREIATLWQAEKTLGATAAGAPGRRIPDPESDGLYKMPGISSVTATIRVTF